MQTLSYAENFKAHLTHVLKSVVYSNLQNNVKQDCLHFKILWSLNNWIHKTWTVLLKHNPVVFSISSVEGTNVTNAKTA